MGEDIEATLDCLQNGKSGIKTLTRFAPLAHAPLPVGEVPVPVDPAEKRSRTHQLARLAVKQAVKGCSEPPDAVVIGTTTGGMANTENHLKNGNDDLFAYRSHSLSSVAKDIAGYVGCDGPALTISTACSSGAAAVLLAAEMVRSRRFRRVLAGGVDSLCRLTYYGFKSLQLIDPGGAKPLDRDRRGMSVAEGAAILVLESGSSGSGEIAILSGGLSCDAYHPAKPQPQGEGAYWAMERALLDGGISKNAVDYINLHGTGTLDNDGSESKAVYRLFGEKPAPLSSIKGATGHSLAASGAIEAVVSFLCVKNGFIPANIGWKNPDPDLGLSPVVKPVAADIKTVLSNSFGFGGNNAALVIGRSRGKTGSDVQKPALPGMKIIGRSLFTGAGDMDRTLCRIREKKSCRGIVDLEKPGRDLPADVVRRLKRLSIMALGLGDGAYENAGKNEKPTSIYFGTGLGALSETHDFLERLFSSGERFSSPTDFIGSVHNAAAGQVAMRFGAKGENITTSGDDDSFEQALFAADLLHKDKTPFLVMAADEGHGKLSPLFDPSVTCSKPLSDGGGALLLKRDEEISAPVITPLILRKNTFDASATEMLAHNIVKPGKTPARFCLILAGIPAAVREKGEKQLDAFINAAGYEGPVMDYRRLFGEFHSASGVAAALAAQIIEHGFSYGGPSRGVSEKTNRKSVLLLGFGKSLTAVRVDPS